MVMKITLPVRFRRRVRRRRGGSARGGGSDCSRVHRRRRLLYLIRFENALCDVLIRIFVQFEFRALSSSEKLYLLSTLNYSSSAAPVVLVDVAVEALHSDGRVGPGLTFRKLVINSLTVIIQAIILQCEQLLAQPEDPPVVVLPPPSGPLLHAELAPPPGPYVLFFHDETTGPEEDISTIQYKIRVH